MIGLCSEVVSAFDISLRAEDEQDVSFLKNLYISIRWPELINTNWPDDCKASFLEGQFQIQTTHYKANFPGLLRWIVAENGVALGRLYFLKTERTYHLVDISLIPSCRNRGLGFLLLQSLCKQAAEEGLVVDLQVAQDNPACRLYERVGFRYTDRGSFYRKMQWTHHIVEASAHLVQTTPMKQVKHV